MAQLAFVFVCAAWGTSFIALERLSHTFGPVTIGIWRLLSAAVALGIVWWWRREAYHWERRYWGPILVSALVANVPAYIIQPYVLAQGFGHSFFGITVAAMPLLTILFSFPMLGIRPTWRQLAGVIGGLVCLWLVVDEGFGRGMSAGFLILAFMIPLTGAFNNTFIKWKLPQASALPVTAAMLGTAGLLLVPLELCRPALQALNIGPPAAPVGGAWPYVLVLLLGVFGTGFSTAAFFYMVYKEGPLFAGMTTYVVPILALAWGELDHETISPHQLAAIAGVLAMVALVQTRSAGAPTPVEPQAGMLPELTPRCIRSESSITMPVTISATAATENTVNAA